MTEEDTFNALARTPFLQLYDIVEAWIANSSDERTMREVLQENKWNYWDWERELNEYRSNLEVLKDGRIKNLLLRRPG